MIYYLIGIDKAKFKRPVVPGDQLIWKQDLLKVNEISGHLNVALK
jgi:hypothetical protein